MSDPVDLSKLRPWSTPLEERCHCEIRDGLVLVHQLSDNPVHCLACNGEVPPEELAWTDELVSRVASWTSIYGALYALWLSSGEYETWAMERLIDIRGEVNVVGRRVTRDLGEANSMPASTWYGWYPPWDIDEFDSQPVVEACPVCGRSLEPVDTSRRRVWVCREHSMLTSR